jgi:minor histocompatibility antigen H13
MTDNTKTVVDPASLNYLSPKNLFTTVCWATIGLALVVPGLIQLPLGVQLLLNSCAVTGLGAIYSVSLATTKDCTPESRLCKRYDVGAGEDGEETMEFKDAAKFPIIASISLFTLYLLMNMINPKLVSGLLNIYICVSATYVMGTYLADRFLSLGWVSDKLWCKVDKKIWYAVDTYHLNLDITENLIAGFGMAMFVNGYYLYSGFWVCNNIIGVTLSVSAIALLKIKDFKTGLLVLWGLFIYDCFWVFKTDVMVSVAKGLNSPIKLMFPITPTLEKFSILGLGDMIIPGLFVAQCLKFDVDRFLKTKPKSMNGFNSTYFNFAMIGYALSILTTFLFMVWFNHAQPALLYIVPFLSVFSVVPAFVLGDFKEFWGYDSGHAIEGEKKEITGEANAEKEMLPEEPKKKTE